MPGFSAETTSRYTVSAAFLALTVYLGYIAERSGFLPFISAYTLFFALYAWVIFKWKWSWSAQRWFIGVGIALRVALLFSLPNLSDDFYRFLWDGRLAAQGIHPFAHVPEYFIENQLPLTGIDSTLFSRLNSPEYYTVYPPVCQGVFWLAAKLFPVNIPGGVLVLKLFLLLCELGTIWVLSAPPTSTLVIRRSSFDIPLRFFSKQYRISNAEYPMPKDRNAELIAPLQGAGVLYALNPLVILEVSGNCHFEGAMLFFLLAGIRLLQQNRQIEAAGLWALATASKLVPLLFLPIIWVQLGWRRGAVFIAAFSGFILLLFAPLLDLQVLQNMAGSLNLYFRQFAFNASVYYVLKAIGKALAGPYADVGRTLGPILGLGVFVGVWIIAFANPPGSKRNPGVHPNPNPGFRLLPEKLLAASALYLALATTVHPWYIILPFGISLLTRWRFPWVWTAAAALSYSHYAGGGFRENYLLIGLEYALVLAALWWDWRQSLVLSPTK